MKLRALLIGFLLAGLTGMGIGAGTASANVRVITLNEIQQIEALSTLSTMSLINWKVGDSEDYKVTLSSFGLTGTMHKEATKEEGNGIWISQKLTLPIMSDSSQMLIDRDTGKVLKYIHNGQPAQIPNSKIQIISTNNATVTVPAGTFRTLHIVAKSSQVKQIQLWINRRQVSLDGGVKVFMDQGQMQITMELSHFVKQ